MYEQKPNSGSLFRNEKKAKETHPDYTGDALIDGKEYWINGWLNQSKAGKKYFAFKFNPKDEKGGQGGQSPELEDEIPFITDGGIR